MSFVSLEFIIFLLVVYLVHYFVPAKFRWCVLLVGSIFFYCFAGWKKLLFVLASCDTAYIVALWIDTIYGDLTIDSREQKRKCRRILFAGISITILLLLYAKIGQRLIDSFVNVYRGEEDFVSIIVPLGISYYTFGIIGYMVDVYYKKDKAERNFFKLLLYMIYFPQILEGPIPRHKKNAIQFESGNRADYKTFCFGVQRMLWGYFKKMVIADRLGVLTSEILTNYKNYEGAYFWVCIIASAFQLYCDFSGCMDIALGASECFGIKLDENFNHPFFSESAAEFWRRWHITLGTWFKDYVYMPIVINPKLIFFTGKARKKFGKKVAKNLMTIVPLAVVWLLTGLWHGTGLDYICWGIYWGVIIICSTVFAPELKKLTEILHIDTDAGWWHTFRKLRTFLIFCGGRALTAPGNIAVSGTILKSMFTTWNPWVLVDDSLYTLGLNLKNFWLVIFSLFFLLFVSYKQERGIKIREKIASYPLPLRWAVYYVAFFSIIIFGMYGPGYNASDFVYMKF